MGEVCKICNKKEDLVQIGYVCGHDAMCCMDCLGKEEDKPKCTSCRKADDSQKVTIQKKQTEDVKIINKCYRCKDDIDITKKGLFKKIEFLECCETNTHRILICSKCYQNSFKKLVSKESENSFCFLCFVDLKKEKLLHYTSKLNCKNNHKVHLCGKCHPTFKKIKQRCPVCEPFEIDQKFCFSCYKPIDFEVNLMPIKCQNMNHKFSICMDCASQLENPYFICRICQNKPQQTYVIFQINENYYNNVSFPGLKFVSNEITSNQIFIDPYSCPYCKEIEVFPTFIEAFDNKQQFWINPCASIVSFKGNILVSGGYSIEQHTSLDLSFTIKFIQDGRFNNYRIEPIHSTLIQKRHFHGSYFSKKQGNVYVMGGVRKTKEKQIEYLDSIELLMIDEISSSLNNLNLEWQKSSFKLKEKRSNFSLVEHEKYVYLFGGFKNISTMSKSIEKINFLNLKSELITIKDFSIPINPVINQKNNIIMLYGGYNGKKRLNSVYSFDTKTDKFHEKKSAFGSLSKEFLSAKLRSVKIMDKFYIFGSKDKFNYAEIDQERLIKVYKTSHFSKKFKIKEENERILDFYEGSLIQFKLDSNDIL